MIVIAWLVIDYLINSETLSKPFEDIYEIYLHALMCYFLKSIENVSRIW